MQYPNSYSEQTPCMYPILLNQLCFINYPKVNIPCNVNHSNKEIAVGVHKCQLFDKNKNDSSPIRLLYFPPVINSDDYTFDSFMQANKFFQMAYGKLTDTEKVKLLHARLAFPYSQFSTLWQIFQEVEKGKNTEFNFKEYKIHLTLFHRHFYAISKYFNIKILITNSELSDLPQCNCYFCRDTFYAKFENDLYKKNNIQKEALDRLRDLIFMWQYEEQSSGKTYVHYIKRRLRIMKYSDKLKDSYIPNLQFHTHTNATYCDYCTYINKQYPGAH